MAMKQVYKYPIRFEGDTLNASFVDRAPVLCEVQHGRATLWMEVRSDLPLVDRSFQIFGTGHTIPEDAVHVGSFQDGPYVWHVYEIKS